MARLLLLAMLALTTVASPVEERAINCNAVNTIISLMRQQHVATPFCSSMLKIPTITQTSTQTSTPPCVTVTQSSSSVATVTAISSEVVYGTTTVYPVVAVSTTSTCEIGATYLPTITSPAEPPPARMVKRGAAPPPPPAGPTPIARPKCLSNFVGSAITSACSCLGIPTSTRVTVSTTTLPARTVSPAYLLPLLTAKSNPQPRSQQSSPAQPR